jgi:hypothetical protein
MQAVFQETAGKRFIFWLFERRLSANEEAPRRYA